METMPPNALYHMVKCMLEPPESIINNTFGLQLKAKFLELQKEMEVLEFEELNPGPFLIPDEYFCLCFPFEKKVAKLALIELRKRTFYTPSQDTRRIPFDIRVLATFSFLKHGHLKYLQHLDVFNYSEHILMTCLAEVCQLIVHFLTPHYVRFPCDDEQLSINKSAFLKRFKLPGVIGILDCFNVELFSINSKYLGVYTNRLGQKCIKVQLICDQSLRFLDANPRFSGCTTNIHIWNRSHVRNIMSNLYQRDSRTWLIADRSYHLEKFVLNPYRNASTPHEEAVNDTLKCVHDVWHRAVSLLKSRFRCLNKPLHYGHIISANIITTCVTLHNFMIDKGVIIEENVEDIPVDKKRYLRKAAMEDPSREGRQNREFLKEYWFYNSDITLGTRL